jgi:hypothetical protein
MGPSSPQHSDRLAREIRTARATIASSRLDSAPREAVWQNWLTFCHQRNIPSPTLEGYDDDARSDVLLAFAVSVRTGSYGRRRPVQTETAEKAVRFVCQKWQLDWRLTDPRKDGDRLKLPFRWLYDKWRHDDPAPKQQLALPYHAVLATAALLRSLGTPAGTVQADLVMIAFFYLLRPGEYTKHQRATRTIPLRRCDIRLWGPHHVLIPHTSPLPVLLQATSATIYLANQKNGEKGGTVHHFRITDPLACPVRALARRVHHLVGISPNDTAPLAQIDASASVTSSMITTALRLGASASNLLNSGYSLDRISGHSHRASGAMALKLNGADIATIKKLGRWSSDTFLMYIHNQISSLTTGLSQLMTIPHVFHNVGS